MADETETVMNVPEGHAVPDFGMKGVYRDKAGPQLTGNQTEGSTYAGAVYAEAQKSIAEAKQREIDEATTWKEFVAAHKGSGKSMKELSELWADRTGTAGDE